MADNEQDILFRLRTEGETEGAEQVTEAIQDTGEAAKKAEKESRKAAEEERRRAEETATRQSDAVEGWGRVAAKFSEYGALLKKHANELQGLSGSQQQFISKTGEALEIAGSFGTAVSEGFSQGGPIGAVVAGAVNAAGQIYQAWKETDAQLNKTEESIRNAGEASRRLGEMKTKLPMAEAAREASALLDEVYQKALRNERIRESERSLEQTQTDEAGRAGVASGAITEQQAEARSQMKQFSLAGEDIVSDLKVAADHLAKLKADVETAKRDAGLMAEGSEAQTKKLEEAKNLQDQVIELATKLGDDQKIAINKVRELAIKAEAGADEIGQEHLAALEDNARKLLNGLRSAGEESGKTLTQTQRSAFSNLEKLLRETGDLNRLGVREAVGELQKILRSGVFKPGDEEDVKSALTYVAEGAANGDKNIARQIQIQVQAIQNRVDADVRGLEARLMQRLPGGPDRAPAQQFNEQIREAIQLTREDGRAQIQELRQALADGRDGRAAAVRDVIAESEDQLTTVMRQMADRMTYQSKAASEILTTVLADGELRLHEVSKYIEAVGRLNGASEKGHGEVMGAFAEARQLIAAHSGEIIALKNSFASMAADFQTQIRAVGPWR
jgi:hypothetical protein